MTHPQHAVSKWIGHSMAVSERHYLQLTEDVFDAANGLADVRSQRAAKCAAFGAAKGAAALPRTNVHADTFAGVGGAASGHDIETCGAAACIDVNGPARIRTENQEIMSPLL